MSVKHIHVLAVTSDEHDKISNNVPCRQYISLEELNKQVDGPINRRWAR
ncbi:MAG TPA: hypothetical protein VNG51_10475 [Ktedonobacteraceae bacterium]|nr:hypothetical protein [Ktedonobacteraceae bacterium]